MNLLLKSKILNLKSKITISGSKSETNRLLLLKALYPNIILENASNSDDSNVMIEALRFQPAVQGFRICDVHHAGTAMRFLAAYFAIYSGKKTFLEGSERMKERPIKILVDALNQLGAEITYTGKEGFPPLKIIGKKLTKSQVSLPANVSSQYISALLLIAPKLENGLELTLTGTITSLPYIKMTLNLLNEIGVETSFTDNKICVFPLSKIQNPKTYIIESDWSSASYFYSIIAMSAVNTEILLSNFKENSLQGDAILKTIFLDFGVETVFVENAMYLKKIDKKLPEKIELNLQNAPDIAQTIAVTCFGLNIDCKLTGLHTLKIKETDRLEALKTELSKLGANINVTNDSLSIVSGTMYLIASEKSVKTYQDHRMAMAFAPLALKTSLIIEDFEVVSKSYPDFWKDLKKIGFEMNEF